jgi:predicted nucleic acid-binding protein
LAFQNSEWLYTSDYILDECISVAWSKTTKLDTEFRLSLIRNLDDVIQNSAKLKLEKVGETDFATAKSYLKKHAEVIPKLTDWTSIVLMRRNNISKILSLDGDFREVRSLTEFNWVERINQATQISPNP